jgi:hypothetical protein
MARPRESGIPPWLSPGKVSGTTAGSVARRKRPRIVPASTAMRERIEAVSWRPSLFRPVCGRQDNVWLRAEGTRFNARLVNGPKACPAPVVWPSPSLGHAISSVSGCIDLPAEASPPVLTISGDEPAASGSNSGLESTPCARGPVTPLSALHRDRHFPHRIQLRPLFGSGRTSTTSSPNSDGMKSWSTTRVSTCWPFRASSATGEIAAVGDGTRTTSGAAWPRHGVRRRGTPSTACQRRRPCRWRAPRPFWKTIVNAGTTILTLEPAGTDAAGAVRRRVAASPPRPPLHPAPS